MPGPGSRERALHDLRTTVPDANVHLRTADLSLMREVRILADGLRRDLPRLHVLVNNAGVILGRRRVTAEGLETTFATNHLAPFLLTNLLLDTLRASAPSRVITVSSAAHRTGRMHWGDLQLVRGYLGLRAYSQSKLANILFTRALARRLEGTGVTANCLHPGFVATNLGQGTYILFRIGMRLGGPLVRSAVQGAETSIHLACSAEMAGITGQYFADRSIVTPTRAAQDRDSEERLWAESARITGVSGALGSS